MRISVLFMALLFITSLASADIGPSPAAPDITIRFEKEGSAYFDITNLTYHCSLGETNETSPMDEREIDMLCVAGLCRNDLWFYKLNPCYHSSGYFSYEYEGITIMTEQEDFSDSRTYDYTVDVESGDFTSMVALPEEVFGFCGPSLIVGGILGLAFIMGREDV